MGGGIAAASSNFTTGTIYDGGATNIDTSFYNITAGGSIATAVASTTGTQFAAGQMVWSPDLTVAYYANYTTNNVVAIDPNGVVSVFATGITGPTGLLMTSSGRLLVASTALSKVIDITGGGNFSSATTLISGLNGPRDMLEVSPGVIYIANGGPGTVTKYENGVSSNFATGLSTVANLVLWNGHVYADTYTGTPNQIYDITAGGDFTGAAGFASGLTFGGLTVDSSDHLLANVLGDFRVYDVTAGGVFSTASPTFASIPNTRREDSFLNTVPDAFTPIPEPGSLLLVAAGLIYTRFRRFSRPA